MPVIIFFSSTISILYYWGWMQACIEKIAWCMQYTMGTTAAESTNAAGNIFIGQVKMTPSRSRQVINNVTYDITSTLWCFFFSHLVDGSTIVDKTHAKLHDEV